MSSRTFPSTLFWLPVKDLNGIFDALRFSRVRRSHWPLVWRGNLALLVSALEKRLPRRRRLVVQSLMRLMNSSTWSATVTINVELLGLIIFPTILQVFRCNVWTAIRYRCKIGCRFSVSILVVSFSWLVDHYLLLVQQALRGVCHLRFPFEQPVARYDTMQMWPEELRPIWFNVGIFSFSVLYYSLKVSFSALKLYSHQCWAFFTNFPGF